MKFRKGAHSAKSGVTKKTTGIVAGSLLGLSLVIGGGVTYANWDSREVADTAVTIKTDDWGAPVITTESLPKFKAGTPYSQTLAATYGTNAVWTIKSGALPTGLILSPVGLISGTPTINGNFNFTVEVATNRGVNAKDFTLLPEYAAPTITTSTLGDATKGVAYTATLAATGESNVFSISAGSLPAGITLNANSGVLSGTPTAESVSNFTLTVTNPGGSVTKDFVLRVNLVKPVLAAKYLSGVAVGSQYSIPVTWTGDATSFAVSSGSLPPGLAVNPTTGRITGVATATGTYAFNLTASSSGGTSTVGYSIKATNPVNLVNNGSFETSAAVIVSENLALNPEAKSTGTAVGVADSAAYSRYIEPNTGTAPPGLPTLTSGVVLSQAAGITSPTLFAGSNFDGQGNLATLRLNGMWVFVAGGPFSATVGGGVTTPLKANDWTFVQTGDSRTGSTASRLVIAKSDGTNVTSGNFAIVTGIVSVKQTMNNVYYSNYLSAADYFSGNTAAKDGVTNTWTGAVNASISRRTAQAPVGAGGGAAILYSSTEWASSGTKSLRVESVYPGPGSAYVDLQNMTGTPTLAEMRGKTWTMIAKSRTTAARSYGAGIGMVQIVNGQALNELVYGSTAPGINDIRSTFTIDPNATEIYLRLYGTVLKGEPDAWFDDYMLIEGVYTEGYLAAPTTQTLDPITLNIGKATTYQLPKNTPVATWALASGTMPAGLTLDPAGSITGTPTTSGVVTLTLRATNSLGAGNSTLTITVAPKPVITRTTLPNGLKDTAYSETLTWTGGNVTFAVTAGALPAGLTLNTTTGVISGTPTTVSVSNFTITATNESGTASQAYSITVPTPPALTKTTLPNGAKNVAYSQTLTYTGTGVNFALISGTLPTGITLNNSTGVISGTPTGGGVSSFTIKIASANGFSTQAYTINIPQPTELVKNGDFEAGITNWSWRIAGGDIANGATPSSVGSYEGARYARVTEGMLTSDKIPVTTGEALAFKFAYRNVGLTAQSLAYAGIIYTDDAGKELFVDYRIPVSVPWALGSYNVTVPAGYKYAQVYFSGDYEVGATTVYDNVSLNGIR